MKNKHPGPQDELPTERQRLELIHCVPFRTMALCGSSRIVLRL